MDPNMDSNAVEVLQRANHIVELADYDRRKFPLFVLVWAVEFVALILLTLYLIK